MTTMHEDPQGDPEGYVPNPRPMLAWARRVLDEAATAWSTHEEYRKRRAETEDRDYIPDFLTPIASAQAMATIAQAAALLQPTPEEVLAAYEGVATEVDTEAASKLEDVRAILDEARRKGPRHPAITAALKTIEGG